MVGGGLSGEQVVSRYGVEDLAEGVVGVGAYILVIICFLW